MKEKSKAERNELRHYPRKDESLTMQSNEIGSVSARGMLPQAVNSGAVVKPHTGICVPEHGVDPKSLSPLSYESAKAMIQR